MKNEKTIDIWNNFYFVLAYNRLFFFNEYGDFSDLSLDEMESLAFALVIQLYCKKRKLMKK